jgi:hypothetical protein
MRLLYDKWRLPLDDSFQESEEHDACVFRQTDREVYVRRYCAGLSREEGIQRVKARANPRHITYFEDNWDHLYQWAFKWAEEKETPCPNRFSIEAHYVIEGEDLTVIVDHKHFEDARWAAMFVYGVQLERNWNVQGSVYVFAQGPTWVMGAHSRSQEGEWFTNRFLGSLRTDAAPASLGNLVRQALGSTRRNVPARSRSRHAASSRHYQAINRRLGVKSLDSLMGVMDIIDVLAEDEVIKLIPNWAQRGFDYQNGYLPMYSQKVSLPRRRSNEELGLGLLEAKKRCYGWGDETDAPQ